MARCTWGTLALASLISACSVADETSEPGDQYAGSPAGDTDGSGDQSGGDDGTGGSDDADSGAQGVTLSTGCSSYDGGVYTPFVNYGPVSSGNVAKYPWRGHASTYPDTIEDFRAYGPSLPQEIECGSAKDARDYVDVTSGCLTAVDVSGNKAGQIHGTTDGYYRSFALPYDPEHQRQVAWTDMVVEYRFYYSQWTNDISGPGFKAFARYLTEYDLYVGSWRKDGVVQIQKKQCGEYTVLKRDANYGPPAPNMWHTIRFEVVGNEQRLYLDGRLAMATTDDSIKRGTAGIRIDSAEGALIDDWRVTAP
jgi:hypothetical protein